MKLIIDIDEKVLNKLPEAELGSNVIEDVLEAVENGTILSKDQGRLIILSEDAVKREQYAMSFSCQNWISEVGLSNATVAIIEADKETDDYYRGAQEEF